ncbi:elongator complex protein 3 [candidate division CSSED10-310 bacterium]|uniref:Elongator complex protein 3 n=1 Tax=candidate division CSSED10-310 bacterium TaxID=2855610 RepID=A0ABV6YWZ8_UNCC1
MDSCSTKVTILPFFLPYHGCPTRCSYCNQHITGNAPGQSPESDFVTTISSYLASMKSGKRGSAVEAAFYGGSFTGLPEKIQFFYLEQAQTFLRSGEISALRISTRPDMIDRDTVRMLSEAGVKVVELGVPSLVQDVLDAAQRGHTVADVENATRILRDADIRTGFQLMFGLPRDTRKTMKQTLTGVTALQPDFVRIHPAIVLTGTDLARHYGRGSYKPLTMAKAIAIACQWVTRFQKENIGVIRMGLQAVDVMREQETVVAGPFHPAFGSLVLEALARRKLRHLIKRHNSLRPEVCLEISEWQISQYVGHHSANIMWLKRQFPYLKNIKIVATHDALPEPRIMDM